VPSPAHSTTAFISQLPSHFMDSAGRLHPALRVRPRGGMRPLSKVHHLAHFAHGLRRDRLRSLRAVGQYGPDVIEVVS